MRYFSLILIFLTACAYKPINNDFCVKDTPAGIPVHEHCAYDIQGADFEFGTDPKTGSVTNYTLHGQNITAEQYEVLALRISPWSYAEEKKSLLSYCHANPNVCSYSALAQKIDDFEERMQLDRRVYPKWRDEMLGLE